MAKLQPDCGQAAATACRQLGFCDETEKITEANMDRYTKVFEKDLTRDHVKALAYSFGWNPPEGGQNQEVDQPC